MMLAGKTWVGDGEEAVWTVQITEQVKSKVIGECKCECTSASVRSAPRGAKSQSAYSRLPLTPPPPLPPSLPLPCSP